jgi:steroid 5-alpha reductase family enzyme
MFSELDTSFQHLISQWFILMAAVVVLCFLVSEITRNYSQVDKLWSLMPVAYSWMAAVSFPSPRLFLMAILVTLWGLRLSYNFYRKGGYNIIPWKGTEDYRWQIMRYNPVLKGRIRFGLFNLFFISLYQNLLILLFSSPLLPASLYHDQPLTGVDLIAAILVLTFVIIESIADNQQFRFHQEKQIGGFNEKHYTASLKKGFLTEGLWRYVRHPNFAAEQGMWISFYLFGVAASGQWINPTLAGCVLLVLLFAGSTWLTEGISSRKYPDYAVYQKEVPKFIPRIRDLIRNQRKS